MAKYDNVLHFVERGKQLIEEELDSKQQLQQVFKNDWQFYLELEQHYSELRQWDQLTKCVIV